jgi:hypothetical protein
LGEEDKKLPQVENILPLLKRGIGPSVSDFCVFAALEMLFDRRVSFFMSLDLSLQEFTTVVCCPF